LDDYDGELKDPKTAFYITDTMVAPLGACLRRMGLSVVAGENEHQICDMAIKNFTAKILTAGRACKRYPSNRVIKVNSVLSVDKQIMGFLLEEKIRLDPDNFESRCVKCNGNTMIYVPTCVLRYLHYQMAVLKNIDIGIDLDDFAELEEQMGDLDSDLPDKYSCLISNGELGYAALTPQAIIYMELVLNI
jgi:hypothetical protein